MNKIKYYDPEPLFADECMLNLIMGSRDTGKSYSITKKSIELVVESGYNRQIVYNRRYKDMITKSQIELAFEKLIADNVISELTNGEFETLHYYHPKLSFANIVNGKVQKSDKVLAYATSLENVQNLKNTNLGKADIFLFEEFMPQVNEPHIWNEVKAFDSLLGTLLRGDIPETFKAYFIGNTTKPISPYFEHFQLKRVLDMVPGDIDYYKFNHPEAQHLALTVRVEYTQTFNQLNNTYRLKDVWFMFSESGKMITDGGWDIPTYPTFPEDIKTRKQIEFYIIESKQKIKGTLFATPNFMFIHHQLLSPQFSIPEDSITFSTEFSINYHNLVSPLSPIPQLQDKQYIQECYKQSRCTFDSNITAAHVIEYLKMSRNRNLLLS